MEKGPDILNQARTIHNDLVEWRRDLHRYPELGFEEIRSAEIVATHLKECGYQVETQVAKTGVVGLLEGRTKSPVLMLRFDMDALPINETNQVEYASRNQGKMHACGHDGHIAIGLGVAKLLARYQDQLAGTVKLVFQPAEEGMGGAELMMQEGVMDNPSVDGILALHLRSDLPVGQVAVTAGPIMAASEKWDLKVIGKGGHGAEPHKAVDSIMAAVQIISASQTIISRSIDPQKEAVLSVGSIHAGETFNSIPASVELSGTIRSFNQDVHGKILDRFEQIIDGTSKAMGVMPEFQSVLTCPALVNDPRMTEILHGAAAKLIGEENVYSGVRLLGAEDASFFFNAAPGCYMFLGASNEERELNYPHHNPRFDFDEAALAMGVAILVQASFDYFSQAKE